LNIFNVLGDMLNLGYYCWYLLSRIPLRLQKLIRHRCHQYLLKFLNGCLLSSKSRQLLILEYNLLLYVLLRRLCEGDELISNHGCGNHSNWVVVDQILITVKWIENHCLYTIHLVTRRHHKSSLCILPLQR
jgi:hypothetical protein